MTPEASDDPPTEVEHSKPVGMVTVELTRESREGIGEYTKTFNESSPGVWGAEDQVCTVSTLYGATVECDESADDGSFVVSYTASLFTVDTESALRVVCPVGVGSDDLTADLEQHLR